jgi:hypothetical protein
VADKDLITPDLLMAPDPSQTSFREPPQPRSKLYWLDIDVAFNDLIRLQRMTPFSPIVRAPPRSPQHPVLHGVGTATNALSVGDAANVFDHFAVDVAAFVQAEEDFALPQHHRSAKMIWNEVDIRSPRLQIHVQPKMLRHLVELYVTRRIDTVIISMNIAIERKTLVDLNPYYRFLTVMGVYTFDAQSANSWPFRLRWPVSPSGDRRETGIAFTPSAPRPASYPIRRRAFHGAVSRDRSKSASGLPRRDPDR